jgi:hypothetical protein
LFLSLLPLAFLLLSLFSVKAKECRSSAETSRSDLGRTRKAVVTILLVIAFAVTAVVVPVAVVLSRAITVAVTVVVLVAAVVILALRILRIRTIAFRMLRVKRRESRVPGARLKALVTSASTIPVLAVAPNAKASPRDAAILVPGCTQPALVVSWLTAVIIVVVVALGRAILMNSLSPAPVGRALSRCDVIRVPAVSVSSARLVPIATSSRGRVGNWIARAATAS